MLSLRNVNQYRSFWGGLIIFSFYLPYVKEKNLFKKEIIETNGEPNHINQICSNILTDDI